MTRTTAGPTAHSAHLMQSLAVEAEHLTRVIEQWQAVRYPGRLSPAMLNQDPRTRHPEDSDR